MRVAATNQPPNNTLIHFKLSYVCPKTWLFRKDEGWLACENIRFSSLFAAGDVSRGGTCLRLSDRNSILMTQINVYLINPVVMGFQMQICPILCFSWSISEKCCVHLQMSSSKTQMLLYSTNMDCFVRDSLHLHLTFATFCLLSVIRKQ